MEEDRLPDRVRQPGLRVVCRSQVKVHLVGRVRRAALHQRDRECRVELRAVCPRQDRVRLAGDKVVHLVVDKAPLAAPRLLQTREQSADTTPKPGRFYGPIPAFSA